MDLSGLSDQELLGKLEALTETERFSMADFLLHLAEVDRRRACERTSHGTLFAYLTRRLGFSEADAVRRIKAARAADKYPSILRMLAAGELHLIGVSMLEPVLTSENHERLLRRASRRSTREIEAMAASLSAPEPGPKDRIRALPPPCKPPPAILDEIAAPPEPLPGLAPTPRPDPAEAAGNVQRGSGYFCAIIADVSAFCAAAPGSSSISNTVTAPIKSAATPIHT